MHFAIEVGEQPDIENIRWPTLTRHRRETVEVMGLLSNPGLFDEVADVFRAVTPDDPYRSG